MTLLHLLEGVFLGPLMDIPTATIFPRSDAAATINFPLLALAATIPGLRLLQGCINYTLHDSLLFSSINFDCHVQKYYFW